MGRVALSYRVIPVCNFCIRFSCLTNEHPCKTRKLGMAGRTTRSDWQLDQNDAEDKAFYCEAEVTKLVGKQDWTSKRLLP